MSAWDSLENWLMMRVSPQQADQCKEIVRRIVAEEREACAQLIDDLPPEEYVSVNPAVLIRARSNS